MKYRKHKDFTVSEVGIGCYALSGAYGTKGVKEFKQMLDHAHDLGVNFFDTADTYGNMERILVKWLYHTVMRSISPQGGS